MCGKVTKRTLQLANTTFPSGRGWMESEGFIGPHLALHAAVLVRADLYKPATALSPSLFSSSSPWACPARPALQGTTATTADVTGTGGSGWVGLGWVLGRTGCLPSLQLCVRLSRDCNRDRFRDADEACEIRCCSTCRSGRRAARETGRARPVQRLCRDSFICLAATATDHFDRVAQSRCREPWLLEMSCSVRLLLLLLLLLQAGLAASPANTSYRALLRFALLCFLFPLLLSTSPAILRQVYGGVG